MLALQNYFYDVINYLIANIIVLELKNSKTIRYLETLSNLFHQIIGLY